MWGGVCEVNVGRELVPWQETSIWKGGCNEGGFGEGG